MMSFVISIAVLFALLALATAIGQAMIERRHPPSGRFVDVSGGRLHVAAFGTLGNASDAPLVLLHGASGNLQDMRLALGETLGKKWHGFLLDRPGHGWSCSLRGPDDASPLRQAALIHEALGKLGVTRPILVAHSLGGAIATAYALAYPDDISGLVLIAPTTHPWEGGISWYYSITTAPVIGRLFVWTCALPIGMLLVPKAVEEVFDPQQAPDDYVRHAAIRLVLRPNSFLANAQDVSALHDNLSRQFPHYGEIRVPAVILTGDRDDVVSPEVHSRAIAAMIPDARLEILHGIGHMPHHARPDRIKAAVEEVQERAKAALG